MFGDRVYLFGSHDTPGGESFCLEDYEFFSAPLHDLSHWTSRGTNYFAKQDPLYGENARYLYAPDVVRGNDGRYDLDYCLSGWLEGGGRLFPSHPCGGLRHTGRENGESAVRRKEHEHEIRCKSLPFPHGYRMCGTAAPGWEKELFYAAVPGCGFRAFSVPATACR